MDCGRSSWVNYLNNVTTRDTMIGVYQRRTSRMAITMTVPMTVMEVLGTCSGTTMEWQRTRNNTNWSLFSNITENRYWSGTEYTPDSSSKRGTTTLSIFTKVKTETFPVILWWLGCAIRQCRYHLFPLPSGYLDRLWGLVFSERTAQRLGS